MSVRWRIWPCLVATLGIVLLVSGCAGGSLSGDSSSSALSVVAAENFYGDIVKQVGGNYVSVQSILADPNIDPHEYEANIKNTLAVAKAKLVIENGGGYDEWMDKLLSSTPDSSRLVMKAFDSAPQKLPNNEHVWYNIDDVQAIAQAIAVDLKKLDAAHASAFDKNVQGFIQSLQQIRQKMHTIKAKVNGTAVGLTETIFQYQAIPMGLKVLTPMEFQKAMAEGNDPPANTVVVAENQIKNRQIAVLIYNQQAASQITTKLQNDAHAAHIPAVPVTETMPPDKTYQSWMLDQLNLLAQSLGA